MARIVVTDPVADEGLSRLRAAGHDVVPCSADDVASAEAWIVRSGTRIGAAELARAPSLRAIGRCGVGTDNIDLAAATARGVAVFHSPTGNITSAAEQAWALMLAVARHVPAADAAMKRGAWARAELQGTELFGKTLLLLGLGRIGRMMATRGVAFGMQVVGHDPFVTAEQAQAAGVEWVELGEGLRRADVVSLHAPLTPQTRHLIDAEALAAMKAGAILVNAARGGLVDGTALLAALEAGQLRGAGLDVWEEEPPTDWRLADHPRVVAAPHLGASTEEAQVRAAVEACTRVADFLASGDAGLAVNAQVAVPAAVRPWALLAEALAGLAVQTVEGRLSEVVVAATPGLDADVLRVHALVGALRAGTDEPVNAINAPATAAAKGWTVASRTSPGDGDWMRVEVRTDRQGVDVEGTFTPHYGPRVSRIDGMDVEFRPEGRLLVTRHDDVPGVLAAVTHVLAEAELNVAAVSLGRADGQAVAAIHVDGGIPKAVRDALRGLDHVHAAHRVRL